MDPFEKQFRKRANLQAIFAFVVGVAVAYLLQITLNFGSSQLLTVLIVLGVGGLWYHIRRVV